jgi:hypothetical protein
MIEATFKPLEVDDSIPLREATEGYWVVTCSPLDGTPDEIIVSGALVGVDYLGRVFIAARKPRWSDVKAVDFSKGFRVRPVRDGEALVFGDAK